MENVQQIMSEIKDTLKQVSASQKDEVRVMRGMLNDPNYSVGIYEKSGKVGEYSPYEDSRKLVANIVSGTTGIGSQEAASLANSYEFTKNDSSIMIGISKEFVNTYLQTGRKLPLGGREYNKVDLCLKKVPEKEKAVPSKVAEERKTTIVPAHEAIRAICPCPSWLK